MYQHDDVASATGGENAQGHRARGTAAAGALARMAVMFTSGAFLVVEPLYARHVLGRPLS